MKAYGHLPPLVQEEERSLKHGWFFDNPDFSDWDHSSVPSILHLGGQSRHENWAIFLELSKLLEDRGSSMIYFSSLFPEGERNGVLKPLEYRHRLFRTLISQLAKGDMSLLLDLVGYDAMHEMIGAQRLSRSNTVSKGLARLFYHILARQQEDRLYVLIDGLDVLGHQMGGFIDELISLQNKLRELKSANGYEPVVKIFISTPPQIRSRALDEKTLYSTDFDARPGTVHDPDSSTYQWLEEDESYIGWESSGVSSLLLIQGKPGSGKSTLAKRIVNAIKNSTDLERSMVAYFFYSYRGGRKETSHTVMMQSILYQLLSKEPEFFPAFRERYRARRKSDGNAVCWRLEDLVDIFGALSDMERDGKIFVILDAMDESDNEDLPVILRTMVSICSPKSSGLLFKGVITTRPLRRKAAGLDLDTLTAYSLIMENKNRSDINKVVDEQIKTILQAVRSTDDELDLAVLDGIKDYIKEHAEGVFLWVDLILREFKSLSDEGFSKSQLHQLKTMLPPKLTDVYGQITERLAKNQPREIKQGRKLLQLAAFSLERLRLEEIRDAIIIPSYLEEHRFVPDARILDDRVIGLERRIKVVCGDLLENRRPFVQLIHESVRDFLLSKDQSAAPFHMSEEQGNNDVTSIFTRYLTWCLSPQALIAAGIERDETADWEEHDYERFLSLLEDRPLLNYVVSSLLRHVELTTHKGIKEEFSRVLKGLDQSQAARYLLLDSTLSSFLALATDDEIADASTFRFKLMVLAAKFGHVKAIRQLATVNTPMEPMDDEAETSPLHAAIARGQQGAVALLLGLRADPHFQDQLGEMALHKAVKHGQLGIMKTILDNDSYANAPSLIHETPLHLAAARGYVDMVKLLLDHGADCDSDDQYDATPLHKAVENNHILVAKILLDDGAEVDADGTYERREPRPEPEEP
ncbi:hypothetical protein IL306_008073 [Fusarium sp. DS 682]|nr:hypothetical protein IL306_008073 [Fusarium sp. DS 682]